MRALWKMVAVPGLTYANAVLCLSSGIREFLERRQREIGRLALGVHKHTPVEAVQGEMGWSSFMAREATAKVAYEDRLLRLPEQNIARRMLVHTIFAGRTTRWTRRTVALRRRFELPPVCLEKAEEAQRTRPGEGVRQRVRERETHTWQRSSETKSSLALYRSEKLDIRTEPFYDNSKGSALLAEARAGVLRTRLWRARFTEGIVATCAICGTADETLRHVTLECGRVLPPAGTTALPTALGFRPEEGRDVWQAVEITKRRLEFWWQGGALRK